MPGLINFRDFGGEWTSSGRRVRTDRLYRCGHLADLTDAEIEHIVGLDFAVIVDLRYAGEREAEPSPWPPHLLDRVLAHEGERDGDAPHVALMRQGVLTAEAVQGLYRLFYADIPFNRLYQPLFAETFRRIAATDGRSLIHCTAGKDRTGVQAALILHCLGVPREAIFADFMRSSKAPGLLAMKDSMKVRVKARYGQEMPDQAIDALIDVRREYIEIALATIEDRCGAIEAYLAESGVGEDTLAALRARLLEP